MDVMKIAEGMKNAKKIIRHEGEKSPDPNIDLEELATIYAEQDTKKPKQNYNKIENKNIGKVIVYVDDGKFYDLHGSEFEVIDIGGLRQTTKIEKGDKFVWDKHLVRGLGEISNVDKIGQTEEIYDIDDGYINDFDANKFRLYFNPLTYKKCQLNINSED